MKRSYLKYFLSLLLFGSNGIVASFISLTSYEIVLLRTLIGSIFLIGMFKLCGQEFTFPKYKKQLLFLMTSGMALGGSWLFLYEAYVQIGVGISTLAYYCGPVIVMILAPVIFNEKLTVSKIIGFTAVLYGVFLVNHNMTLSGQGSNAFGLFCGGMSAVMYALMVISSKKVNDIVGLENSLIQIASAFLTVAVYTVIKHGFVIEIGTSNIVPILILGVVNTGIGCYLYFSSLASLPIQTVAICGYLEPLSAVIFSAVFLKEIMAPVQIIGTILILSGAIFGECNVFEKRYKSA